ncbi:MAG: GIY-YIG nuclease family protein, partial [Patescibacteria group bacterium]
PERGPRVRIPASPPDYALLRLAGQTRNRHLEQARQEINKSMWCVYVLKSRQIKKWIYVGSTNNLRRRIIEHTSGKSLSVKPYLPIYLATFIAIPTEWQARRLEKYLKVGSGKVILKKRILADEA